MSLTLDVASNGNCKKKVMQCIMGNEKATSFSFSGLMGSHRKAFSEPATTDGGQSTETLAWRKRDALILCNFPLRSFPKLITRSVILQSAPLSSSPPSLLFFSCLVLLLFLSVVLSQRAVIRFLSFSPPHHSLPAFPPSFGALIQLRTP